MYQNPQPRRLFETWQFFETPRSNRPLQYYDLIDALKLLGKK